MREERNKDFDSNIENHGDFQSRGKEEGHKIGGERKKIQGSQEQRDMAMPRHSLAMPHFSRL